jgi:CSLREA domain-containing protein
MHSRTLASRILFIISLILIGLAIRSISPTAEIAAAPAAPTFTVNSFGDAIAAAPLTNGVCETSPGNHICTLRAAIMKANHYPGGSVTINLSAGTYGLAISPSGSDNELTGDLNITNTMTINGVSAASTILDANQIDRVLYTGPGTVTLSNMTLRNGKTVYDGGGLYNYGLLTLKHVIIENNSAASGGGLYTILRPLTLNDSAVTNNQAISDGGGLLNYSDKLTLNDSTVNNNSAGANAGGIMNFDGTLLLNNSTLSNNSAWQCCGGIYNNQTVNAYYSTIVGNLADSGALQTNAVGGIYNEGGTVNLKGVLLAQNYSAVTPSDCQGTLTSMGYNLIQTTTNCTIAGVGTGNITGVADVLIDSLKNNGGSTPTRALLAGSPAINAIPTAQCLDQFAAPLTQDQRGLPRPNGGACDIGAYEGSLPTPLYNRNLIRNGDAEAMAGSLSGSTIGLPNWSRTYSGTLVPYGAPGGFPTITDTGPLDRGFGFFAGGVASSSYITQEINIASIGAAIDASKVHYALSGYFGGYLTDNDYAALYVTFENASHDYISDDSTGFVDPVGRSNLTGLLFRSTTDFVPTGTRFIVIELDMLRFDGSYNDGYADNLTLVLWPLNVYLPLVLK